MQVERDDSHQHNNKSGIGHAPATRIAEQESAPLPGTGNDEDRNDHASNDRRHNEQHDGQNGQRDDCSHDALFEHFRPPGPRYSRIDADD